MGGGGHKFHWFIMIIWDFKLMKNDKINEYRRGCRVVVVTDTFLRNNKIKSVPRLVSTGWTTLYTAFGDEFRIIIEKSHY